VFCRTLIQRSDPRGGHIGETLTVLRFTVLWLAHLHYYYCWLLLLLALLRVHIAGAMGFGSDLFGLLKMVLKGRQSLRSKILHRRIFPGLALTLKFSYVL